MKYFKYLIIFVLLISCKTIQNNQDKIIIEKENTKYTYENSILITYEIPSVNNFIKFRNNIDGFHIGTSEISYDLWEEVFDWATNNGYSFIYKGHRGFIKEKDTKAYTYGNYPVAGIFWLDAAVWCNALTDYTNEKLGTEYKKVYYIDNEFKEPFKIATKELIEKMTIEHASYPFTNNHSNGFRLPYAYEWECAEKYIDGASWYDSSEYFVNSNEIIDRIKAEINNDKKVEHKTKKFETPIIGSGIKNKIGLDGFYDKPDEWCNDLLFTKEKNEPTRYTRGNIDDLFMAFTYNMNSLMGFRIAKRN